MRVVFDIIHPADVHFFRLAITKLLDRGDAVLVSSRDKEVTLELLDESGIPHQVISRKPKGLALMFFELGQRNLHLWRSARLFEPDLFVSSNSASASQVARVMGRPSLVFDDTEINRLMRLLYRPFASEIHTPRCYRMDLGRKHLRYAGYHSLAYLRPEQFTPDSDVLAREGVRLGEKLVLLRFVGHDTAHDVGGAWPTLDRKRALVRELGRQARVVISSETALPADLEPQRARCRATELHHLLHFATLVVGESATMASEAVALGTPAILIDEQGRGYTDEQESHYSLCTTLKPTRWEQVIERALWILAQADSPEVTRAAHTRLLSDTIDVSDYQIAQMERLARQSQIQRR